MTDDPRSTPPTTPTAETDERRGVLSGDRACIACGFNLSGQTIVRERHYRMLIVRCPECGVAASLQEYPLLGPWSARLGTAVAGLWALILLGGAIITALAMWGFSDTLATSLSSRYAQRITDAAQQHFNEKNKGTTPNPYQYNTFDEDWWNALPPEKFFADAGGWAGAVQWSALWNILPAALVMAVFGAFWSVAICHARRRTLLIVAGIITALAAAFMAVDYATSDTTWYWMGGYQVAKQQVGWRLSPIGLLAGTAALFLGMLIGRTIVRAVILLFLPPRLRAPLSFLWICDGKPLPRP